MNRILIASVFAASAAACLHARADDPTIDPHVFVSTRSRAEVKAELVDFRTSGVDPWADGYNPLTTFHGDRARDDVKAEFLRSRNEVAAMNGEDSGSMYLSARARVTTGPVLAGDPGQAQ